MQPMTNRNRQLIAVALPLCVVALLSGCSAAFNPIGSNTYDCNRKQDPASIYCHSFKAVEASTKSELPDSRFDTELKFSDYDKATDIAPVGKPHEEQPPLRSGAGERVVMGDSSSAAQTIKASSAKQPVAADGMPDGMPVREGPVVLRTWIKHFVDSNDMLTSDTTVYKEIVQPHWAGFDGGNPAGALHGMYPHKAADAKTVAAATPQQPSVPASTDFIQPGPQSSAGESSPGSSMPTSMPQ
jgi:conjugal transfer pilus assembly protein TraV